MSPANRPRLAQTVKNDAIFHGTRALMKVGALIPLKIGLRLGGVIGGLAFTLLRPDREKALRHLAVAFPEKSPQWRERTARDSFRYLGRSFFELFHFDEILSNAPPWAGYCEIVGLEHLDRAREQGRGGLLITAHVGNWELMAATVAQQGYPLSEIVRSLYDERIDTLLNDHRRRYRYFPMPRGGQDMEAILGVFRRNEFLAILMDQDTRVRGMWAPFLGPDAFTPSGPAFLAYKMDVDGIPVFNHRTPEGRFRVEIGEPIPRPKTGDIEADSLEYTRRLNAVIGDHIRRHPTQWVWMHERWKRRPVGEPTHEHPAPSPPPGRWTRRLLVATGKRLATPGRWGRADALGAFLGRLSALTSASRRNQTKQNMRTALGARYREAELTRIARRAAEYRGRTAVDYLSAERLDDEFFERRVAIEGLSRLDASLQKGAGVVLVAGHLGSLDLGLWALGRRGYRVALVDRPVEDRFFSHWIERLRAAHRLTTWRPDIPPAVMDGWLSAGGCLTFAIDRNVPRERGVFVRFFGRYVNTDRLPAETALRTGAAVHAYTCVRRGPGLHRVEISEALTVDPLADDPVRDLTQRMTAVWELAVETYPEQWIWGHDRFVLRPDE